MMMGLDWTSACNHRKINRIRYVENRDTVVILVLFLRVRMEINEFYTVAIIRGSTSQIRKIRGQSSYR